MLLPDETSAYCREVKALVLANDDDGALAKAIQFWNQAGPAMRDALTGDAAAKAMRKIFRAEEIEDAREMALLIIAGEEMLKVQMTLPKPPARITEEVLWQLRAIYDVLIDAQSRCRALCRGGGDEPAATSLRSAAPAFDDKPPDRRCPDLQDRYGPGGRNHLRRAWIRCRRRSWPPATGAFDADMLLAQVEGFSELSSSVVKEMEMRARRRMGPAPSEGSLPRWAM